MKELIMKEKYNTILADFNYKIKDIFDKYEVNFYDMSLIENNIEIFCAYLVLCEVEEDLIIDIIIDYTNCLIDELDNEEIQNIIKKISNNIIYIEENILQNSDINPLKELSTITIENCVDKDKNYNYLYLNLEIAIVIKYVMIEITNIK